MTTRARDPVADDDARPDLLVLLLGGGLAVATLLVAGDLVDFAETPKRVWLELGAAALAALLFGRAYFRKLPVDGRLLPFDLPVAALTLWTIASTFWAGDGYAAVTSAAAATTAGVLYFVSSRAARRAVDARAVAVALVAGGAAVSILGIAQVMAGVEWVPQIAPPASTFANKNVAASFLVLVWPLAVWGVLAAPRGPVALAATGACALVLVYFGDTFARSAWLAAAVQLVFGVAPVLRARSALWARRGRVAALAALVALGLSYTSEGWRFFPAEALGYVGAVSRTAPAVADVAAGGAAADELLLRDAKSSSLTERVAVWLNASAMIGDHPVAGVGAGNFAREYPAYARARARDVVTSGTQRWEKAHNDWVQLTVELGLVGLLLWLWLSLAVARAAARQARARHIDANGALRVALCASLIGLAVDAVFNFPLQQALPPAVAAVLLGLLARPHADERSPRAMGPGIAEACFGLALVALFAGGYLEQRRVRAELELDDAGLALTRAAWPQVRRHAEASWALNPHVWLTASLLGRAALEQNDLDVGLAAMEQVLARRPHQSPALYNAGMVWLRRGETERAAAYLTRAKKIAPSYCRARHGLAAVLAQQGRPEEAARERAEAERCDREVPRSRGW